MWYAVVCFLAINQIQGALGGIAAIFLLIAYVFILRNVQHFFGEIEEAGYSVEAASVCLSSGRLALIVAAVLVTGIVSGYLFFHRYPMEWLEDPGFYGTEAVCLSPAYYEKDEWKQCGELSGRILYDVDGRTYAAPYESLEEVDAHMKLSPWFTYVHQRRWMQYPVMTAKEKNIAKYIMINEPFIQRQGVFQFDSGDGSTELTN